MLTRSTERKPLFIAGTGLACGLIGLAAYSNAAPAWHAGAGTLLGLMLGLAVTVLRRNEF